MTRFVFLEKCAPGDEQFSIIISMLYTPCIKNDSNYKFSFIALATANASKGGTAFPTCLY